MTDKQGEIIGRQSLLWLLLVNLCVLAPLYDKMTPWSMAICAICLVWRVGIFTGKVAKPPRYLVTGLAIASAVTLALVTTQIGLLNGLINLLILGYALKYIEMRDRRDVRAVVLVGFFLIAGVLIGPGALGIVEQGTLIDTLAEVMLGAFRVVREMMPQTAVAGPEAADDQPVHHGAVGGDEAVRVQRPAHQRQRRDRQRLVHLRQHVLVREEPQLRHVPLELLLAGALGGGGLVPGLGRRVLVRVGRVVLQHGHGLLHDDGAVIVFAVGSRSMPPSRVPPSSRSWTGSGFHASRH